MIAEALYKTINPVLTSFPLEAVAQVNEAGEPESVNPPLAVYSESIEPFRTKSGIAHYTGELFVAVICRTKLEVRSYSNQMIQALEGLTGTTVEGTEFLQVRQSNPVAIDYDPGDQVYYSELTFTFKSNNQ